MIYADANYVLGVINPNDRLHDEALEQRAEYGDEIVVPYLTVVELFLVYYDEDDPTLDYSAFSNDIADAFDLGFDESVMHTAAELMDSGSTPFDAFHMATADRDDRYDRLLTSDTEFENSPIGVLGYGDAANLY